ncbi:MAG: sulfite exporter TauE/SafE family protein [Chitinophagaceae bacterium]|nr:sulfite exporter TauE/SafE family protein [Chitinophagaceae bacterium]
MEIAGYIAAAFIGILLGMMGGGGSILTVPMLVYLFRMQPLYATSYSLFIVGFTSLTGAFGNYLKGLVHIRTAILFGISSFVTVFAVRKWIVPAIPDIIISTPYVELTSSALTMILFAVLMVIAAISMLQNKEGKNSRYITNASLPVVKLLLYGAGIGIVTGLLGAGGGFLLIPVLVVLLQLPMKEAIGTSLLIISINSLIGFAGDLGHYHMDWKKLLLITSIAVAGIFAGVALSQKIPAQKLKKAFGWFVLLMGIIILAKEIVNKS